ncbi:MAG: acylneuraminate cytidylyltransferase family protein [Crocinitomicaceae bacterium]
MKFTALLPMKGESERVPGKNMRDFNGEPLFYHILKTLIAVPSIEKIIINTDSEKIKNLAQGFEKVLIHDRPENLIGGMVPMNAIIDYDIEKSGETNFIQTHSTNPLLKAETIQQALEQFENSKEKHDSLFSVTKIQARLYWDDGSPINHNLAELLRTQDLPSVLEENSNYFIFTAKSFNENGKTRIGKTPLMQEVSKIEAIDIDEPEDFLIAEAVQKYLNSTIKS